MFCDSRVFCLLAVINLLTLDVGHSTPLFNEVTLIDILVVFLLKQLKTAHAGCLVLADQPRWVLVISRLASNHFQPGLSWF